MLFRWYDELFWFMGAFALPACLAAYCLTTNRSAAERALGWMLFSQSAWVFGQTLELSATQFVWKLTLDGLQYLPMCASYAWTLIFAHRFAGRPANPWLVGFYCTTAFPAALFYASAPLHGLTRFGAEIRSGDPFDTLYYPFTSGDYFLILGGFVVCCYATILAAVRVLRSHRAYIMPTMPVFLGVALPYAIVVPSMSLGWTILGQRDISFVLFGIGGLFILWGLRGGRGVVVPVARDLLFERIPDPAFVVDQHGVILELNTAASTLFELPHKDDAVLRRLADIRCTNVETATLVTALDSAGTVLVHTKAGRTLRVQAHQLHDLDVHLVVARDVTEEVEAETLRREKQADLERLVETRSRALIATERKFQAIFERSFQMMFLLRRDGTVLDANHAALEVSGAAPESVNGAAFWTLPRFAGADLQCQLQDAVERAGKGELVRLPVLELGETDAQLAVDFSLTPISGQDGRPSLLICEGRDVTQLRRVEEHLRQASKMEAMGTLAGGVAHDFNNLLTVILGNIALLRETTSASDGDVLDDVEQAASHAASLTQQLLAFGRKSMLTRKALDVRTELNSAVRMLGRVIPESIAIVVEIEDGIGAVTFDSSQFQQIILNLAINARDAMANGGTLLLRAEASYGPVSEAGSSDEGADGDTARDWIRVSVVDTGIGMSEETRARIFEPFFTTKELGRGTGLGMAMVYGAVMQQGGHMDVESELGRGTRISVFLKRTELSVAEHTASEIREVVPRGMIYLVEDQAPILRTVASTLRRAGHSVREFGSADELLGVTSLPQPDLLLTDAIMPGTSGFELVERLRARWPDLPCLLMSGYSDDRRMEIAQASGVLFVRKPFVGDDLQRKVREALLQRILLGSMQA